MTYTTSSELLDKRKSNLIPNYISTFSGYEPNGGKTFGHKIMNAKLQNQQKFKKIKTK